MKKRNEQTDELEEWEEGGYEKPLWLDYEKTPEPLRNAECGSRSEEKIVTTNEHEQTRSGSEPPALAGGVDSESVQSMISEIRETTNEHEQTRTGSEPPALAGGVNSESVQSMISEIRETTNEHEQTRTGSE